MKMGERIPATVLSVKQSPLNPKQWCCNLDCGHDQWITAKQRPTRKTLKCDRCAAIAKTKGGET